MKTKKLYTDEKYNVVAVRAKLSVEVEQKKRLGAWGKRVLVLDGATLYAYKLKGEGGSVGGWSVGGAEVHVGKSSDEGRHLLVISRPPVYKLTFSFTTTYEQARMIQALSSSGATVTGLDAIMLLKNLRKKQEEEEAEEERKEVEKRRKTMEDGLVVETLPIPDYFHFGGGGGGGGGGQEDVVDKGEQINEKQEQKVPNKEEEKETGKEEKEEKHVEEEKTKEEEEEEEEEEKESNQAIYTAVSDSSFLRQDKRFTDDKQKEEEEEEDQKKDDEEEERMNPSSQHAHATLNPTTEASRSSNTLPKTQEDTTNEIEGFVNPLPKPPRARPREGSHAEDTDALPCVTAAKLGSADGGAEGVVLVRSEEVSVRGSEVLRSSSARDGDRGSDGELLEVTRDLLATQAVEEEDKEEGSEEEEEEEEISGFYCVNPESDEEDLNKGDSEPGGKTGLRDSQTGPTDSKLAPSEEQRGASDTSTAPSDNKTPTNTKTLNNKTETKDTQTPQRNTKTPTDNNTSSTQGTPNTTDSNTQIAPNSTANTTPQHKLTQQKEDLNDGSYSELISKMRLDRSFSLDTQSLGSAPPSLLPSPSDEVALDTPSSSSSLSPIPRHPKSPDSGYSDDKDDKIKELWQGEGLTDSEEQFERLYKELSGGVVKEEKETKEQGQLGKKHQGQQETATGREKPETVSSEQQQTPEENEVLVSLKGNDGGKETKEYAEVIPQVFHSSSENGQESQKTEQQTPQENYIPEKPLEDKHDQNKQVKENTTVTPENPNSPFDIQEPEKMELKRTNSIIKKRDKDANHTSTTTKKVQFDPHVKSIEPPPALVKENVTKGVSQREKTSVLSTQTQKDSTRLKKDVPSRKTEEGKEKRTSSPASPTRRKPQVMMQDRRKIISEALTRKRGESSPVTKPGQRRTEKGTDKKERPEKAEISRKTDIKTDKVDNKKSVDKTEDTGKADIKRVKGTENKESNEKKENNEKTDKNIEKGEEIQMQMEEETEKHGRTEEKTVENKTKKKEENDSTHKPRETEINASEKNENIKKAETKSNNTVKEESENKTEEMKTETTTTTTTTTTTENNNNNNNNNNKPASASALKRQPTVDPQAPLIISGQVEIAGSVSGRLSGRRVEVRDGHLLAFISRASTPSSRLPLAGLSVIPVLGGGGGGTSVILSRASRCMMVLKLSSREEMMRWIHTLSDEVLKITPEEHLKGLTLYPSPEARRGEKKEHKEEEEEEEEKVQEESEETDKQTEETRENNQERRENVNGKETKLDSEDVDVVKKTVEATKNASSPYSSTQRKPKPFTENEHLMGNQTKPQGSRENIKSSSFLENLNKFKEQQRKTEIRGNKDEIKKENTKRTAEKITALIKKVEEGSGRRTETSKIGTDKDKVEQKLSHPPLRRLSGQGKQGQEQGRDEVDNYLLVNILPEKDTTTKTITTTTTTTTTTTAKPQTSIAPITKPTSTKKPHHHHHPTTTTTTTTSPSSHRHANCFRPNEPLSSFSRSVSGSHSSLTQDDRRTHTTGLRRTESDIHLNKSAERTSLTRQGAVKVKNTSSGKRTNSNSNFSRILAMKDVEIVEKDTKQEDSEGSPSVHPMIRQAPHSLTPMVQKTEGNGHMPSITWSVAATREKFELLYSVTGENKSGKLTTKTPISRRRSVRGSQKRRRTQENAMSPRRQGTIRRSFISTDTTQGSQEDDHDQKSMSLHQETSQMAVKEARKVFENHTTATTTTTTTTDTEDDYPQKEKLTAKKSPLKRTQNILYDSSDTATTAATTIKDHDVVICWRGPYMAQSDIYKTERKAVLPVIMEESEQAVLNNISNAFLAKRRLLTKEVTMARLQERLSLLEERLWELQARLATEDQTVGGDRRSVERAIRSVEEEVTHLYSRLAVVTKEAEQAREKLASALATGLSQWSEHPSALTPRSSLTRRGRGDRRGVKKEKDEDEGEDEGEDKTEEDEEES